MYRHVPIVVPVAIAAFAACAAPAAAQSFVWDNEAGDYLWFEGMNWDPDGVPTGADAIAEADDIIVAASQLVDVNSIFSTGPGLRLTGLASLRVQGLSEIVGLIIDTSIITDITANGPLLITGPSEFNSTVVFNGGSTVAVDSGVFNEGFFADTDVEITGNVTLDPRAGAPGGGAVARSADVTVTGTLNLRPGSNVSSGLFPARWNLEGTFALDGTGASVPDAFVDASILTPGGTVRARNGRIFFSGPYNYSATTIAETGGEIILEGSSGFLTGPDFQGEGIARIRRSTQNFGTINNEMTGPVGLLIESPNLELSGNLVSSGTLSLGNTVMSGSGNLLITGGITRNAIGNPTLPRTELSGGTFEISANNKFNTEFVINGGTLDAKPGAILGDSSQRDSPSNSSPATSPSTRTSPPTPTSTSAHNSRSRAACSSSRPEKSSSETAPHGPAARPTSDPQTPARSSSADSCPTPSTAAPPSTDAESSHSAAPSAPTDPTSS
jgi:hypothetical protein